MSISIGCVAARLWLLGAVTSAAAVVAHDAPLGLFDGPRQRLFLACGVGAAHQLGPVQDILRAAHAVLLGAEVKHQQLVARHRDLRVVLGIQQLRLQSRAW